jgi:hypothetical protein
LRSHATADAGSCPTLPKYFWIVASIALSSAALGLRPVF